MNLLSKIKRPRRATGSQAGTITPQAWNELVDYVCMMENAIRQLTPFSTPDILPTIGAGGTTYRLARHGGGGATAVTGPFCRKFVVTVEEVKTLYLLGGLVTGGEGNFTIPDIELAVIGEEPPDDTFVWLEVDFTAYVEDDVLLPGGDVTAVTPDSGTTVPDNVIPTVDTPAGTVHIVLGQWSQGIFLPSACGNIFVSHCLGELTHNHY